MVDPSFIAKPSGNGATENASDESKVTRGIENTIFYHEKLTAVMVDGSSGAAGQS